MSDDGSNTGAQGATSPGSDGQGASQGTTGGGGGNAPSDYTLAQFRVDLKALSDATANVQSASAEIAGHMQTIGTLAAQLRDHWEGPAYLSQESVQQWFQRTEKQLHELLDDIVRRMKVSYDNFRAAELANFSTLQARTQEVANVPQPPRPRHVLTVEHAGAGGAPAGGTGDAVPRSARTELAAEHVSGEPRVLLPWVPEGEPHAFKPRTELASEYFGGDGSGGAGGGDGGAVPSLPRHELAVEHVNADGSPVDGAGGGDGGAVLRSARTELAVEHVNADGSPVDGSAGDGGSASALPPNEKAVVNEHYQADVSSGGDGGQDGAVPRSARTELATEHVSGEPRVLLPWVPEGEPHAFIPRTELASEYFGGDGSAGAGGGDGGAVPSLPRHELAVEHVNADGSPVDGAGGGDGGAVLRSPRTELAVVHEPPAGEAPQGGTGGQG
ncbi:WXG100 family type VII secretion target [Streptomyces albus]